MGRRAGLRGIQDGAAAAEVEISHPEAGMELSCPLFGAMSHMAVYLHLSLHSGLSDGMYRGHSNSAWVSSIIARWREAGTGRAEW